MSNFNPELIKAQLQQLKPESRKKIKTQSFRNINYYKQRTEEDNQIKWDKMNSIQIFNFVRAISKPYTGAYTYLNKFRKVRIFKCKIVRTKYQLLNSGDFLPIWLRRNVYPNTIAIENDGCNFNIIANYEIIET